jgi:predicted nuclease with TOPRIM domain
MTEYANISIERYTDMVVEIEKLKHKLEKEQIESERRLAHLAECEGKYNELAQNIVEYLIGNNGFLYNWDKERLIEWGLTVSEIEAMVSNYENKTSRESNCKKAE